MKIRIILSSVVFALTFMFLSIVQLKVDTPMLLAERFFRGGGWLQIFVIAFYGAMVFWFMFDKSKSSKWRQATWLAFSLVFFSQLLLGLFVSDTFLMTGKLHLPIPFMILSGPVYRGQLSVMTILFLSTLLLSGPAWCSHICYFGALDSLASGEKMKKRSLGSIWRMKIPLLVIIIAATILLRLLDVEIRLATGIAISFGVVGILIMSIVSRKTGKMVHCLTWCPIGTIVSIGKHINPMRIIIADSCTSCMRCAVSCKYDALKKEDIQKEKPALSCTLCGDCISSCHIGSLQYKFFGFSAERSRNIYLVITIVLHAMTMGLARI